MNFSIYESRFVFGHNITDLMEGVELMKKDGWLPFGTPYPCTSPGNQGYGMMHLIVRDRKNN